MTKNEATIAQINDSLKRAGNESYVEIEDGYINIVDYYGDRHGVSGSLFKTMMQYFGYKTTKELLEAETNLRDAIVLSRKVL